MKLSLPLKENHEALWNWLAENPQEGKLDWPGRKTIFRNNLQQHLKDQLHFSFHTCFACQVAPYNCSKCPVDFGAIKCEYNGSYYRKWKDSHDPNERTKYARLIAKGWKK